MYCVLPENINENMSLESFIDFNDLLIESGIIPVSTKVFNEEEFITESGKITEVMNKVKDKIKNMPIESL